MWECVTYGSPFIAHVVYIVFWLPVTALGIKVESLKQRDREKTRQGERDYDVQSDVYSKAC